MSNVDTHYKKIRYSLKENMLCFIAGFCCLGILLYAGTLLYPFAAKVLEYLNIGIVEMNNAVRGHYR